MNCKNCHSELLLNADFCHHCGAKVIRNRLTLKNLFIHLGETFFNYDNKFLQTIINLIISPGYVSGVRKKYIDPLPFFAISVTISGFYLLIIRKYFPFIFDFGNDIYSDEVQSQLTQVIQEFIFEYNSLLNFIFIPLVAFMSKLVFLKKKYNFTEHLTMYFYTMSLFSIFSVVFTLAILSVFPDYFLTMSGILYSLFFIYMCMVLVKIFSLNFGQLLIKILIFIPILFLLKPWSQG